MHFSCEMSRNSIASSEFMLFFRIKVRTILVIERCPPRSKPYTLPRSKPCFSLFYRSFYDYASHGITASFYSFGTLHISLSPGFHKPLVILQGREQLEKCFLVDYHLVAWQIIRVVSFRRYFRNQLEVAVKVVDLLVGQVVDINNVGTIIVKPRQQVVKENERVPSR